MGTFSFHPSTDQCKPSGETRVHVTSSPFVLILAQQHFRMTAHCRQPDIRGSSEDELSGADRGLTDSVITGIHPGEVLGLAAPFPCGVCKEGSPHSPTVTCVTPLPL